MGIAETEQKILEELQQLAEEPEKDKKDSEELLEEVTKEPEEEETGEEETEEKSEEETEEESKDGEEEESVTDSEEEEEEVKPGAQMRHKLKAAKAAEADKARENQELRERLARLEGRADATPVSEAPKEEIPDPEYEPEKYAQYQNGKLEKRVQEMEATQKRVNAERQWETMQTEHARISPDYNNAKEFLIQHETQKLKDRHPSATDAQIAQAIKQAEYAEAGNAAKAGIVPTAHIEYLAYKAGYRIEDKPKEAPKKKPNIKEIKKNAKKSASLIGGSPAGDGGDARTPQQLLNMSLEEIHKFGADEYNKAIEKAVARHS